MYQKNLSQSEKTFTAIGRGLKKSMCLGLALTLPLTISFHPVFSNAQSLEKQLAGIVLHYEEMKPPSIVPSVSGPAIVISGSAITTPSVSGSAVEVEAKKSKYENKGISIADDYVCVRKKKSTSSKIVGRLYEGSMARICSTSGKWVKVKSGSVSGYVMKKYLAIGKEAEKVSQDYVIEKAKVQTETLMLREKRSTDSKILDLLGENDSLRVLKNDDEWVKVKSGDETGYVSADYVKVVETFKEAVIEKEKTKTSQKKQITAKKSATGPAPTGKSGSAIASYALQFVGNPYVYGGTSLTNGTDCSGFTQSVLRRFGISIPRTSSSQAGVGVAIRPSQAQAGDLIFYAKNGKINHVALCIGGGRVVHASSPSTGIRTSNLYYRTPVAARRVVR